MSNRPRWDIAVVNRQSTHFVEESRLVNAAVGVLTLEQVATAEISIAVVDDAEIHRINRQFLQHDEPTDVVTFSLIDEAPPNFQPGDSRIRRGAGRRLEGELVVSVETAARCAEAVGWSCLDELLLYVVHGVFHLCGYDDLTDEESPVMRLREREALAALGLPPCSGDDWSMRRVR